MSATGWPDEWTRGLLPFAVLSLLSVQESHGYELLEKLEREGVGRFKGGTIYPLLQRLEEQELIRHRWAHPESGPARKIFNLTPAGQRAQDDLRHRWSKFTTTIEHLGESL
jgi:PadR family transcriptional regulator PadR